MVGVVSNDINKCSNTMCNCYIEEWQATNCTKYHYETVNELFDLKGVYDYSSMYEVWVDLENGKYVIKKTSEKVGKCSGNINPMWLRQIHPDEQYDIEEDWNVEINSGIDYIELY